MLPDEFPVYRGFNRDGTEWGLSWTTDSIRGKWFACRWLGGDGVGYRAEGMVFKSDVIAHFNGRNESEIVVLPWNVRDMKIIEVPKLLGR